MAGQIILNDGDEITESAIRTLLGRELISGHVGSGLGIEYFDDDTIDVAPGVAHILHDGQDITVNADGFTGLAVASNAVNHVWIAVDPSAADDDAAVSIVTNTTGVAPSNPSLKLAKVDSNQSGASAVDPLNRSNPTTLSDEQVREIVAAFMTAGENVTLTRNDASDTLSIDVETGGQTGDSLTDEEVQDIVGAMVTGDGATTATYDDAAGTLTVSSTDTDTQLTVEGVTSAINGETITPSQTVTGSIAVGGGPSVDNIAGSGLSITDGRLEVTAASDDSSGVEDATFIGTDDDLATALGTAAPGRLIVVLAGTHRLSQPVVMDTGGVHLHLRPDAIVESPDISDTSTRTIEVRSDNCAITGQGTFDGRQADQGLDGEGSSILGLYDVSNFLLDGPTLENPPCGDCLYMDYVENSVFQNFVADGAYRNGISLIQGRNVTLENFIARNTSGTDPQAGVDIEPNNAGEPLEDITLRDFAIENSAKRGLYLQFGKLATDDLADITLENGVARDNREGFQFRKAIAGEPGIRGTNLRAIGNDWAGFDIGAAHSVRLSECVALNNCQNNDGSGSTTAAYFAGSVADDAPGEIDLTDCAAYDFQSTRTQGRPGVFNNGDVTLNGFRIGAHANEDTIFVGVNGQVRHSAVIRSDRGDPFVADGSVTAIDGGDGGRSISEQTGFAANLSDSGIGTSYQQVNIASTEYDNANARSGEEYVAPNDGVYDISVALKFDVSDNTKRVVARVSLNSGYIAPAKAVSGSGDGFTTVEITRREQLVAGDSIGIEAYSGVSSTDVSGTFTVSQVW